MVGLRPKRPWQGCAYVIHHSFSKYLVSIGFPPELAAVTTPEDYFDDRDRAWKDILRQVQGRQAEQGPNPLVPELLARAQATTRPILGPDVNQLLDELDVQFKPDDERFPIFTAAELNSTRFDTRYLISDVLVAGQPGGIFGAFKTLKTSLTADLLISLASGTPFLGHFPVVEPGRTLFLSGESGLAALQSIARRICAARGLSLETLDNFLITPKLPSLDSSEDVRALRRIIQAKKPVCVAIDPAYLAVRPGEAHNLFAMGSILRPLAELCDITGCTLLIVHHCKRSKQVAGDPATLDDIAWSGFAEFSAQWLMLSRRRRFNPETGSHELWFSTGGRAGHHGLWALDVDESGPDGPPASADSRVWNTAIRAVASAAAEIEDLQLWAAQGRRERQSVAVLKRNRQRVLATLAAIESGETPRYLRHKLGLTCAGVNAVLGSLADEGLIEPVQIQKRDRIENGYRVVPGGKAFPGGKTDSFPARRETIS
jgi:hypothetical protein